MHFNRLYKIIKFHRFNFFTIEDIGKKKINNGILILENHYFDMVVITLDGIIDERERENEIQEQLEIYFEEYDSFNYIIKKITLYKDENLEKIFIALLKREIAEKIIENCVFEKIQIEGIYPICFVEFFNKDGKVKEYVEISEEKFYIFSFKNDGLYNFQNIDFSREDLIENPQYLKDYLNLNSYIFSYENYKKDIGMDFINYRNWREYNLEYNKELDFLPLEYRRGIEEKRTIKFLAIILSIIILLFSSISLLLNIYITNEKKSLSLKEIEIDDLKEKIENKRRNILIYQEEIESLEKNVAEEKNKKIYSWLKKIIDYKENLVDIRSIEYLENEKIYISGTTSNRSNFYKYQRLLLDNKILKEMNHDFFRLVGDKYEFKIEGTL